MDKKIVHIVIADDHTLFRSGIISLIESEDNIIIAGEADNGSQLLDKYFELKPDLILLDISMPVMTGLEAAKLIRKQDQKVKILFLSMHEGEDYIYHCIKSGGDGLINKNILKSELINAINTLMNENRYFGKNFTDTQIEEIIKRYDSFIEVPKFIQPIRLTEKEKEVLLLISEGLTSSEIADRLNIGKRTVDTHRINIMQKLNLNSLPELIKYSIDYSTALGVRFRNTE
jgi:DNA-binding NarL/FixJ family response regulator